MQEEYKYYAFISYSSHDAKWGRKLQKKLEDYKMSSTICQEHGWKRKPLNPIFFAPTDIQPGPLSAELQDRLRASRNLIVVCSPHAAKSQWVSREIEYFHSLGRAEHIYFFIVEGIPHSGNPDTECFNSVTEKLGLPEILGANINERIYSWPWLNRERAYVQLVTKLLGIEFDTIWQRHRRQLFMQIVFWVLGFLLLLGIISTAWNMNKPVHVGLSLIENNQRNTSLPALKGAVVHFQIDKEIKTDTIHCLADTAYFLNIPKKYMGKEVHVHITCKDYLDVDTAITLSDHVSVRMNRDRRVYGHIHFRLWNANSEMPVPNRYVYVDGIKVRSDSLGFVDLMIPLERQKQIYIVHSDEFELTDSLVYMPSGKNDGICIK